MALVCCFLGKFLGVVCHCFPPMFLKHLMLSYHLSIFQVADVLTKFPHTFLICSISIIHYMPPLQFITLLIPGDLYKNDALPPISSYTASVTDIILSFFFLRYFQPLPFLQRYYGSQPNKTACKLLYFL